MALPDKFLEELRNRCEIENVISGYVALKKNNSRSVGLCPFHSEKTPSFTVFVESQSYYCFGCGSGGDVITFIRNIENLDYIDAVKKLAENCGLEMPDEQNFKDYGIKREQIYKINKDAAKFFHSELMGEKGKAALAYLSENRRLSTNTITKFGLGFAPESWDSLIKHMNGLGYDTNQLREAGLVAKSSKGSYYDYFRNRVIFPIIDVRGNVIAFGGRVMDDSKPKYLNSPDTAAFKKTYNLYALNFAKTMTEKKFVLCEGYMDVIAVSQAGIGGAIATLGTAITPEQARLVSRYANEVIISYDADEAGQKATKKAVELLSATGITVKVLSITGNKDPDEYIKMYGADKFRSLINDSGDHTQFKLNTALAKYDISREQEKVNYLKEAISILGALPNQIERDVYAGKIAHELDVDKASIIHELQKVVRKNQNKNKKAVYSEEKSKLYGQRSKIVPEKSTKIKAVRAEEAIIANLFYYPYFYDDIKEKISSDDFVTEFNKRLYSEITEIIKRQAAPDTIMLSQSFSPEEMGVVSGILADKGKISGTKDEINELIDTLITENEKIKAKFSEEISKEDLNDIINNIRYRKER